MTRGLKLKAQEAHESTKYIERSVVIILTYSIIYIIQTLYDNNINIHQRIYFH